MQSLAALLESNITRTILALLAICASFIIYRLNKKKKGLAYRIVTKTTLFDVDAEIGSRVQVLLDGHPAGRIGLVMIEIENTGNEAIKPDEFVEPLVFKFGDKSQILSADVTKTKPRNLGAKVEFDATTVTVAPLLLNPGDEMFVKVLLREFDGRIDGDARVVGISEVRRRFESVPLALAKVSTWLSLLTAVAGSLASALSLDIAKNLPAFFAKTIPTLVGTIVLPVLAVILGYYFGQVRRVEKSEQEKKETN